MAGFGNGIGLRRPWLLTLSLLAVVGTIAAGALLWQAVELGSIASVSERLDPLWPLMSGLHLGLIALLALFWPRLSFPGAGSGHDSAETRARWMALRWRVVGWLLVIELVVGQNLFGRLVSVMGGPA